MLPPEERWRSYLGDYVVSTYGRVKNIKTGRMRKLFVNVNGYHAWTMHQNGGVRPYLVHRAVLETFVGPCPKGSVARHIDGNPCNNYLENLAWGTYKENMRDQYRHGTRARGNTYITARLNPEKVRAIRRSDEPGTVLAERYGVSKVTISCVRRRKTWAWISDE